MGKTFALLVGINDYQPASGVAKLQGCVTDVGNFEAWLTASTPAEALSIRKLTDAAATRAGIITGFREHLGQARAGDVAVFQYCGHGARSASAPEFLQYFPIGKDEGLVCVDSRINGTSDLADKELAVLIAELAVHNPHITIILDCCHSGSGTRNADTLRGRRVRASYEITTPRPLDSFIDGYYAKLRDKGQAIAIPQARHVLLSACDRNQLAQETQDVDDHAGIFTTTLCEVLNKSRGALSYADLFVRCRAAVISRADDQNPQFEAVGGFDGQSGFLGRNVPVSAARYSIAHGDAGWMLDCGAVHGLPTDPGKPVTLALYGEDAPGTRVGGATAVQIGAQQSQVELDFAGDPATRYRAEITSMPASPLLLAFGGDAALGDALEAAFARATASPLALAAAGAATDYALAVNAGQLQLVQRATDRIVAAERYDPAQPDAAVAALLPALQHVAAWERSLALSNPATAFDTSLVDFEFHSPQLEDGHAPARSTPAFDIEVGGATLPLGKLTVTNRSNQLLQAILAYYSPDFGVQILRNEPIGEDGVPVTMWGGETIGFTLEPGQNHSIENFKLFVSTERVDDFLLAMAPLSTARVRGIGDVMPVKIYENEWFTRNCRVHVTRQLAATGASDVSVAKGKIVIKGHPAVTANIALSAAAPPTRGLAAAPDFYRALAHQGLDLVNFANTRGDAENVLELTGITNGAALKDNPLHIELNVPLAENEAIVPLVFDGTHVLFGGDAYKDDAGKTQISISELPPAAVTTRSLTGAIKMYFFKTYLKAGNVNLLRRVEYLPDGGFAYRTTEIAERVAAARNILLLVHGIIGDTEGMAAGVKACGVADRFDLVLTYDYESLNTLIGDTARALQAALATVGIGPDDGKSLTLLVHSMGGLVSRWFIEREGGKACVDHLVMCGTPNNGSPFGRIDGARKIAKLLTGLAMNYLPATIPVASALMLLLNRSSKVTPALEQMNPDSDFIKTLNASPDPRVRTTILAGNVDEYQEPSDAFFAQLIAKIGQNDAFELLFGQRPNDIAVGVDSILTFGTARPTEPARQHIACHHLNYFVSDTGQAALKKVAWN